MARIKNKRQSKSIQTSIIERTALYIRVSTQKQADEGFSLEAQQEKLEAFCVAQDWTVDATDVYIDAGVSGKSTDRTEFNRMVKAAEAGEVNRIVSLKLDRLARNTKDFLALVEKLDSVGCGLVLVKESFDTSTPHGKFALTMFAAMAELEVSTIQERTMSGRRQKAANGGGNGKRCPHGYKFVDGQCGLIVDIFNMFIDRDSLSMIASRLNDEGHRTARGGKWYPATIKYILNNGFYAGLIQYEDSEVIGSHEAIISVDMYNKANARLAGLKPGPQ